MRSNRLGGVAIGCAVAILLGCGSAATHADDEKPGEAPKDQKKDEKAPDKAPEKKDDKAGEKKDEKAGEKKNEKKPERFFDVMVTDKPTAAPFLVSDAAVFVPEVSLLGGEGGKAVKEIVVKHGPAEITIPLQDIASVKVVGIKEDRLEVAVQFKDPATAGSELTGTIKSNLQLQGKYKKSNLEARIKLRDVYEVTLTEVPAPPVK